MGGRRIVHIEILAQVGKFTEARITRAYPFGREKVCVEFLHTHQLVHLPCFQDAQYRFLEMSRQVARQRAEEEFGRPDYLA